MWSVALNIGPLRPTDSTRLDGHLRLGARRVQAVRQMISCDGAEETAWHGRRARQGTRAHVSACTFVAYEQLRVGDRPFSAQSWRRWRESGQLRTRKRRRLGQRRLSAPILIQVGEIGAGTA